jgi:hypothetical protein
MLLHKPNQFRLKHQPTKLGALANFESADSAEPPIVAWWAPMAPWRCRLAVSFWQPEDSWLASGGEGFAPSEGQGDFAQGHAQLAHNSFVQHHSVVHQIHPIVKLNMPHRPVNGQSKGVLPLKRIALGLT